MLKNVKMFCALLATRTEGSRRMPHLLALPGVRRWQFKMPTLSVLLALHTHSHTRFHLPRPFSGCLVKCSHKYVNVRYVNGLSGCTHSVA